MSEELASKAAVEFATYDARLATIETRLTVLVVLVGGLYAVTLPIVLLLLRIAVKMGAI